MIDTQAIRNKILDLAIRGELTEQLPEDGTAEELYQQIQAEKAALIKDGKIKNQKPLPEITEDEIPFDIPPTWKWVRLGDLYEINPKVEADDKLDAAFVPMERISAGFSGDFTYETQAWDAASKNHTRFANGDVAFAKISPCFENRKSFVAKDLPNGIGGGTTELIILRQKAVLPEYTYYLLLDQRFINAGSGQYKGIVGQQRVKSNVVKEYLIPLPPLAEQKRIVEAVGTCFALLDSIDEKQQSYARSFEVLKSKIIDAAIRGELTEQLPEDGTAEELYQQIQTEKAALIKDGKIKNQKPLPEITEDEIPFDIPASWRWCKFSQLVDFHLGKTPARGNTSYWNDAKYPWVSISDIQQYGLLQRTRESISQNAVDECFTKNISPAGTLIMSFKLTIGKVAILGIDAFHNEAIISIFPKCSNDSIFKSYLFWTLPLIAQNTEAHGAIKGNTLNKKSLSEMLIPLPPLAEQKRIVKRIEELLAAMPE